VGLITSSLLIIVILGELISRVSKIFPALSLITILPAPLRIGWLKSAIKSLARGTCCLLLAGSKALIWSGSGGVVFSKYLIRPPPVPIKRPYDELDGKLFIQLI
jgi:hypothetical protein